MKKNNDLENQKIEISKSLNIKKIREDLFDNNQLVELLIYIIKNLNEEGIFLVKQEKAAKDLKCHKGTIKRNLDSLVLYGVLSKSEIYKVFRIYYIKPKFLKNSTNPEKLFFNQKKIMREWERKERYKVYYQLLPYGYL